MNVFPIAAAEQQADFIQTNGSDRRIMERRSTLASSSAGSRGEASWMTALMIALALLALWAWLRLA